MSVNEQAGPVRKFDSDLFGFVAPDSANHLAVKELCGSACLVFKILTVHTQSSG
jgi:hypothetical protein